MRTLLLFLIVVVCSPAMGSERLDKAALEGLPNLSFHEPNFVASGRIEPDDVAMLFAAGIEVVIDLSDEEETPEFDESAAITEAGMRYNNLPIDGAAGLTEENVETLDRLMAAAGDAPTLIHCGSSNRVGALVALRAATLQGQSVETAIEIGKAWGLMGLEPAVREQLAKSSAAAPTTDSAATSKLQFPRITSSGGVYAMPAGVELPARNIIHRVVIDATTDATTPTGGNRHLEAAARAINLYALAGVPAENVKVAVVIHGKAAPLVLSDASHQRLLGSPNPDAGIIAELHKAGVELFVCGQSTSHRGYAPADLRDEITLALSAMTKLAELQAAGYGLVP
ncbi:DsrE family protein [Dokdonella sp.]|uniref:DsrE family protein n=1 Tax=Dokdonella sp. TaxID=2291710 RepID=UPI003C4B7DC9